MFYFCEKHLLFQPVQLLLMELFFFNIQCMMGNLNNDIYIFSLSWDLWPKVPDYRHANVCAPSNFWMLTGFQNKTFMSIIKVHNCNWLSHSPKALSRLPLLSVWSFMQRGELLCVGVSAYTLCVIMQAIMA